MRIDAKLPSLNEVVAKNRANRYMGAKMKREVQDMIGWYIRKSDLKPVDCCTISIKWHEKTRRRDVDNIQSAQKFILDALVENGILKDDSRRYVRQIYHEIIDDTTDYVEVELNDCTRGEEST